MRDFVAAGRTRGDAGADVGETFTHSRGRKGWPGVVRTGRGVVIRTAEIAHGREGGRMGVRPRRSMHVRSRWKADPGGRRIVAEDGSRRGSHAVDRCGRQTVGNGRDCTRQTAVEYGWSASAGISRSRPLRQMAGRPRRRSYAAGRGGDRNRTRPSAAEDGRPVAVEIVRSRPWRKMGGRPLRKLQVAGDGKRPAVAEDGRPAARHGGCARPAPAEDGRPAAQRRSCTFQT